ncbi:formylglycine-generating enzyme family protein [Candidatus Methylospira mobilis]|uniref:formylglycine-generating enzyme family protein n=1 Tax=Candidatus Methylospira mobilis TaxID=1808979 RepID=UPI0028EC99EC|nr:formylglycine-generating enzyme family protein [Candidatus Methylospira mobilis]WNV03775.1 formylglycine-generating enzyme family protein [Candidatus Methylospira mobilis]
MIEILLMMALMWVVNAEASSFRDCAGCPEMVELTAGSFQMGAAGQRAAMTEPVHSVALPRFAIGKYEITRKEWKAVMGGGPPGKAGACGDACPVTSVNWHEAQVFAERLSARTGKKYRLPTEAEWEYACRAGEQRDFCGGDDPGKAAWYGNTEGGAQKIGLKQPNAWGLYDMSGNVWEWTQDCKHADYNGAPADGSAWVDAGGCGSRILRGGSWLSGSQYSRAALRFAFSPEYRSGDFGFRIVRALD